eukprot:CAMPEP_0168738928 /NCGR_PEP_ID=MMETSP0724-20121128/11191_1 /TAXON_ID=265536 /ORGANISM="Amphiprora sp., Strain CCMP467" /LENGTH=197 /DNA_ID=CAMNT_0008786297 /DNA_START=272 /DNA_END=865 /DNA_ORIENTATION=-
MTNMPVIKANVNRGTAADSVVMASPGPGSSRVARNLPPPALRARRHDAIHDFDPIEIQTNVRLLIPTLSRRANQDDDDDRNFTLQPRRMLLDLPGPHHQQQQHDVFRLHYCAAFVLDAADTFSMGSEEDASMTDWGLPAFPDLDEDEEELLDDDSATWRSCTDSSTSSHGSIESIVLHLKPKLHEAEDYRMLDFFDE